MSDPTPTSTRLLASVAAVLVAGELLLASRWGALLWNGRNDRTGDTLIALSLVVVCGVASPWLAPRRRTPFALLGSLLMGALTTRALILVAVGFAWLCSRVSRTVWPIGAKLALLLGCWAAVTIARGWAPSGSAFGYGSFFLYWACLPPAVICLVVERSRGHLEGVTAFEDASYLLALPRFFLPFLQPIGAKRFFDSRSVASNRLSWQAVGLAAWAVLCMLGVAGLHYQIRGAGNTSLATLAAHVTSNAALIYCVNAATIFGAIAMFRTLGYDLGSGFRFPLLASSFADLYRRWNYYFFEFVSGIFYLPLISALRRRLPMALSHVLAGFMSVWLGVWMMDNFFFQLGIAGWGPEVRREMSDVADLIAHVGIWSLIVVPPVLFAGLRPLRKKRWWRATSHGATLVCCVAVTCALYWWGLTLY